MRIKIIILESTDYNPKALEIYKELGDVYCDIGNPELFSSKNEVSVLVCRLKYHLNSDFLRNYKNLIAIVSPTTGLNHIDQIYCENHGISILSLKNETNFLNSIHSTSEHTMALVLALVRNIVPSVKSVIKDQQWDRYSFKGRELSSMTIGILGLGRIGRHVLSYAKAFEMGIIVCDPLVDNESPELYGIRFCERKELFAESDIITVHVDYNSEKEGMIGKRDFEALKTGSYFVNTSRGELVSEESLLWALETGKLAGAALDVLSNEQDLNGIFGKKLISYAKNNNNLIITPHIGGCTSDAMHNTELFMAENLRRWLAKRLKTGNI